MREEEQGTGSESAYPSPHIKLVCGGAERGGLKQHNQLVLSRKGSKTTDPRAPLAVALSMH